MHTFLIDELSQLIGVDQVQSKPEELKRWGLNLTEYPARKLLAVVSPTKRAQVAQIMKRVERARVPVYPISTGRNWGVGSKLPLTDGCILLDMSLLREVGWIDADLGLALVEPGVTQRSLCDTLCGLKIPWMVNVTGSGEHTSVVGNLLERGVGMLGQRQHEVCGLEVVLANGEILRTGLWQHHKGELPETSFAHYASSLGPDLSGIFLQSNLGIVTRALIKLAPILPVSVGLICCPDDAFQPYMNTLRSLRQSGVLADRIEIDASTDPRLVDAPLPKNAPTQGRFWLTWLQLMGEAEIVAAQKNVIAAKLPKSCTLSFFDSPDGHNSEPLNSRFERLRGNPTNHSLEAIVASKGLDFDPKVDLDDNPRLPGFVCVLPALPFLGKEIARAVDIIERVSKEEGLVCDLTFNSISPISMEGYLRVIFDRQDPDDIKRAHRWNQAAHAALRTAGFLPLRLNVEQMPEFYGDRAEHCTLSQIKDALDPHGIVAPGRYCPLA